MNAATRQAMFSGGRARWATPRAMYAALDAEFRFTLDPCPLDESATAGASLWGKDGLARSWRGERVFCNPPYGREVGRWLAKGREADLAAFLLPARTDTAWFHDHALHADELRFLRGRLRFNDGSPLARAPFPSLLVIYREAQP